MKKLLQFTIISTLLILTSCEWINGPDDNNPAKTELRSAYEVILEVNAIKQARLYDVLKAFSNDYNSEFLQNDLTYEEIDAVFENLTYVLQYEDEIDNAVNTINKAESSTLLGKQKSKYHDEFLGVGSALKDFFTWASGSGERSRKRILKVASNMPEGERSKLYNNLRKNWKDKSDNEQDFWNKLEKGDYDTQAPQMFNDFYHDAETDFPFIAQDKDLKIQKIVVKEGAEGISKGAKVIVEVTKAATPLGKGIELVEKVDEYKEKGEKLFKNPGEFVKDEIKGKIADKIGSYIDVDGMIDGADIGEEAGEALKTILDAGLGSDNPSDWVKSTIDWGLAKIVDSDENGKQIDMVVAENEDKDKQTQFVLGVGDKKVGVNTEIDIGLPEGIWNIKAIDPDGIIDEVISEIVSGLETLVLVSTDEDGEHQKGKYSLSVWISPANPDSYQSVTVYSKIYPEKSGVSITFSVTGTDGYSNTETGTTDSEGKCSFYVPGGAEGVVDDIIIKIDDTGLTRTLTYTF